MGRKLAAEFIGTFLLVFLAVGAAVSGLKPTAEGGVFNGSFGVAVAFGVVLMGLAYALGPTSGCHVNPAVTLAFWLSKRQDGKEAIAYVIEQFVGAAVGASCCGCWSTPAESQTPPGAWGPTRSVAMARTP